MNTLSSGFGHHARKLHSDEVQKLQNDKVVLSEYKIQKLESDAKKNWDLFYKRNKTNFFKDRHWTIREFVELATCDDEKESPVLLEIGCGVGNFIFPLIEENSKFFIHACDFSPRAIDLLKENKLYNSEVCNAFVFDVTKDDFVTVINQDSVDIATMIFVLSAIHPDKMLDVLKNVYQVLKPGGLLLIRDYGLYDQAMLRFSSGHKLQDNFYFRQDGTRAFYFSEECVENLAISSGFEIISNNYISRSTINPKEGLCVPRIFIQGKFQKPHYLGIVK